MTQLGEGVAIVVQMMEAAQKCEHKPPNDTWTCNLSGDGEALRGKMIGYYGADIEPSVPSSVNDVNSKSWPSQAHHLIPWQQLQAHPVVQWLDDDPPTPASKPKVPGKVIKDNDYDVDGWQNGKFMPYASSLDEWKTANTDKKREIVAKVMGAAGIQLHQGPHSMNKYSKGEAGYKTRVAEYLAAIHENSLKHIDVVKCPDCKPDPDGKVPPRKNVPRFVHKASERLEVDINLGRIFVSKRAADYEGALG